MKRPHLFGERGHNVNPPPPPGPRPPPPPASPAAEPDRKREFDTALRREIAKDVLAGLAGNHSMVWNRRDVLHDEEPAKELADVAVRLTDALLERLAR